ncbi:MAG: hypothetical protein KF789_06625 [Bdellovibrionaceae bacterium]|nr:hypothetical protein [Pseudobdellovibrionaceae bacterium]
MAAFIIVISLMALAVIAYFLLMIFYPEWVGITGPEAKRTLDEHIEGSDSKDPKDLF